MYTLPGGWECYWTGLILAESFLAAGSPARALEALVIDAENHPRIPPDSHAWRLRLLTETELALGHPEKAHVWADQAVDILPAQIKDEATGHALMARAACHLDRGRLAEAAEDSTCAADAFNTIGLVLDGARARILAARALARSGERDNARRALDMVRSDAQRWGASRIARMAAEEAARMATAPRSRRASGVAVNAWPALTAREREVASFIALGRTNRQIADQLSLSVRTVETHVSRILSKLGVQNRSAIAALVALCVKLG